MRFRKSPSYLIRHGTQYHFRIMIPKMHQEIIGSEVKLSLGTGSIKKARPKAAMLARATFHYLETLDQRKKGMATKAEIRAKLADYLRELLDRHEKQRIDQEEITQDQIAGADVKLDAIFDRVKHGLATGEKDFGRKNTESFIRHCGLEDILKDSELFAFTQRELLKLYQALIKIEKQRADGDYHSNTEREMLVAYPMPTQPQPEIMLPPIKQKRKSSKRLSKLIEQYINENVSDGKWGDSTIAEQKNRLGTVCEIMEDLPISQIDFINTRKMFDSLKHIPANRSKVKKYRDKSIAELLKMKIPANERLSGQTVNNIMGVVSSLFIFAFRHDLMDKNYADGMRVKVDERPDEAKDIFTNEDLKKIFAGLTPIDGYKYWIPLIGLYTGMRLEEIAQLHLGDIKKIEGVWTIDINAQDDKRLKTKAAKRIVPVHKRLIDLGLIQYAKAMLAEEHKRLFPTLKPIKGKYGHYVGKVFSAYLIKLGIKAEDHKVSFHSFRHTFITRAKHSEIQEGFVKQIVGHAGGSTITYGLYGKSYGVKQIKAVVDRIEFGI